AALRVLAALPAGMHQPALLIPDAVQRGLSRVEDFRANDPDASLEILRQLAVLDPNNDSLRTEEVELLKQTIAAHPDNTNRVVELALIYENARELDQSYELLAPYRQRLGATEGARILGQHLLQGGQYEEAYGLLQPYVQARLDQLHQMEQV